MSHLDIILSVLKIKGVSPDPTQPEEYLTVHQGKDCLMTHAVLDSPGSLCPHCGGRGIQWGSRTIHVFLVKNFSQLSS